MDKTAQKRIKELAIEMKADMIDFAQRIIRCPSLSGEEGDVAKKIEAELIKLLYDDVFIDDWGSVTGVIKGTEPGPTIMYNGHMDHVDIGDVSEWEGYDPYGGEIDISEMFAEDGKTLEKTKVIHGRAASDTKGGMAVQIYSGGILARLKKEGYPIKGNYMYTGVVLEEPAEQIGMLGLFEHTLPERGYGVDGVVSCEATSLKLYLGHRGRVELNVEVFGVTSHASAPWLGINAVTKANKLITRVEEYFSRPDLPEDEKLGKSSCALTIINCTPGSMCIVPDRCSITYDRRLVPSETPEMAVEEMQKIIDELASEDPDFKATVKVAAVPRTTYTGKCETIPNIKQGWRIEEEHPFVKACSKGLKDIGEDVSYAYWDFGTDLAMVCGKHHVAAVGYSPMQEFYCHRPVDKIRIDFMERALIGNIAIFEELNDLSQEDFAM